MVTANNINRSPPQPRPNPSGLYSDQVVELLLHARVLSQSLSLHEVEYVTLSVQEAEELCEDEFMMKLATNRAATIAKSVVRVEVSACDERDVKAA